jgi:hypothetical protein
MKRTRGIHGEGRNKKQFLSDGMNGITGPLRRPVPIWEDNIKMHLKETMTGPFYLSILLRCNFQLGNNIYISAYGSFSGSYEHDHEPSNL